MFLDKDQHDDTGNSGVQTPQLLWQGRRWSDRVCPTRPTGPTETGRGDPGTSGRATTRTIPTCEDMTIFLKQFGSNITGFYHDRIFSDKTPMLGAR